jgi:CheY-like chemotaxis protein
LRQAASGHDALDLLAAGYRPHAIFMDLAMPGIDGWETLRRVRQMQLPNVQCAIVSANAFDKALDNDVDIRPDDFIVKPVRHTELLDWLERRLGLQWWYEGDALAQPTAPQPPHPAFPTAEPLSYPNAAALAALAQAVALGYYRGILNTLDEIERSQPAHQAFVHTMRQMAREFQFDAMGQILEQAPS